MTQKSHYLSWSYKIYDHYDRSMGWYLVAGTIVGLLLVYCFVTENYLFAILIFMTMAIVFLRQVYPSPSVQARIDALGVLVGDERYPFEQIKEFWIVNAKDGRDKLYFKQSRGMHGLLVVPIDGIDSDDVRKYMSQYVAENTEYTNEPLDEWMSRVLKL